MTKGLKWEQKDKTEWRWEAKNYQARRAGGGQAMANRNKKSEQSHEPCDLYPLHTSTQTPRCVWEKRFPLLSYLSQRKTTLLWLVWLLYYLFATGDLTPIKNPAKAAYGKKDSFKLKKSHSLPSLISAWTIKTAYWPASTKHRLYFRLKWRFIEISVAVEVFSTQQHTCGFTINEEPS